MMYPDTPIPSRHAAHAGGLRGIRTPVRAARTGPRLWAAAARACTALILAAAGLCAATPAGALTVTGIDVPPQETVAGQTLVLNGAGLRQRFVFHVYVAALYRPQATQDVDAILHGTEPQLLRLTLLRDITSKALTDALNEGLKANCTETELHDMAATIAHFEDFMKAGGEGASGDRVDVIFNQGTVSVSFKNKALGQTQDPRFATALLKVWLGAHPAQESLKSALLGLESKSN